MFSLLHLDLDGAAWNVRDLFLIYLLCCSLNAFQTIFNPADFNRRYEDFIAAAPNSPNAEVIWILSANIQLTPATNGLADEFKETVHIGEGHNLHIRQLSGVRTLTRNYGENATFMVSTNNKFVPVAQCCLVPPFLCGSGATESVVNVKDLFVTVLPTCRLP